MDDQLKPDWKSVELEYKIGKSIRGIAERHGLPEHTITSMAKLKRWDEQISMLQREIDARTDQEIAKQIMMVKELNRLNANDFINDPVTKNFLDQIAAYNSQVNLMHYMGVAKSREILDRLREQLEDKLIELKEAKSDNLRVLNTCADIFSKLVNAQSNLYDMERKLLNLDGTEKESSKTSLDINVNFV